MPASASGSAEAAPSSSPAAAGLGASVRSPSAGSAATQPNDGTLPVVGERWRGKFDITEQIRDDADVRVWLGQCADGQPVVLRAFHPVEPDIRSQAWSKLGGIDSPHVQHARDAQRAGEWRVEIADRPAGTPLTAWRASRAQVAPEIVKAIVSQIAEALGALQAFELVHLGLRPDVIFVTETAGAIHCLVGGLETLTSFDRTQPVPLAADPFYAPPEALGLAVHVPGTGLCAWDWWSLGRIAQELVLGRHVVAHIAKTDAAARTPALIARAEALLQEADPKAPRAGAVETMSGVDAQLLPLLRGLLTSSRDARWTGDNVDRWVRGLPVKEHYDTPRVETHFRWRGRPCTVPEIAAILQGPDHWAENSVQLFESSTPGTLAHFLRWSVSQANAHEQLTSALELADSLPLKLSSPAAQREAVTIIALLQLSGGKLLWRGRPFESATIAAMMSELGEADAVMVLRALSTRSTALQIERIDTAGGRLLTELGRTVGDVEGVLKRYGWLAANDTPGAARLYRLALEPVPTLRGLRDALGQKFAGSDHPAMEKLFKAQNVGRAELVALAWAADIADRCKFYPHEEAARRRAQALRVRGLELVNALTWVQFERALQLGRTVMAGWGWFILTWFVVAVGTAILWAGPRGLAYAVVPGVAAFLFRMVVAIRERTALREVVPDAKWTWRDGPVRCRRELRIAGRGAALRALESELDAVKKELETLATVKPTPEPLPPLPRFAFVRVAGMLSWVLLLACIGVGGWRVTAHPPTAKEFKTAWAPPESAKPKTEPVVNAAKADEKKDEEVKVSWPYKPGDNAEKLSVKSAIEASSAQTAYATKHGRDLVAPYRADTINTLVIMPVPAGSDVGVMLFDGKRGELVNQQVYLLDYAPIPRTWVELNGRKGVFLDR